VHPAIAGILYSCNIIALDPFCHHCIRLSYHNGFTYLQLCPVIHSSLNRADCCRSGAMAGEKIKVEEATISEIVVAGSDCQF